MQSEQEILNAVFNADDKTLNTGTTGGTDGESFVTGTSTGVPAMGVYQTTPDTLTASDIAVIGIDVNRNVKTTQATKIAGEDLTSDLMKVNQVFSYKNVTASGATVVTTAVNSFLHAITFNQPASGVTTVITNASAAGGDIVATIKPETSAVATSQPFTLVYNVLCASGITASQVSAIATGSNLTVSYR